MKRGHCLYVLGMGDTPFRKVGVCSSDLMVRLRNNQTGNPLRLTFLLIASFQSRDHADLAEGLLVGTMQTMSSVPCLGEWSHLEVQDSEFLDRVEESLSSHGGKVLFRNARA